MCCSPLAKTTYPRFNINSREMTCTRVLHAIGTHPQSAMMPVMCMSLSQPPPLYQLLSMSTLKPKQQRRQPSADSALRPSIRPTHHALSLPYPSSSSLPSGPRSCFRRDSAGLNKKRVVFADAKGLALTAVRLFVPEPYVPTSTLLPSPAKMQVQQTTSSKQQRYKYRLGFHQPLLDYKGFLARLREMRVQLESCSISEHVLSGTVCVSHVSVEKAVHVRVTFDSWRSHHDIPCTFLQQERCGGSDMDVFAFDLSLPKSMDPKERVEFCLYFRPAPGATPHWDDNRGQNYRVCLEKDGSNASKPTADALSTQLRPPSWPLNVSLSLQNSAELQYLQRSLSSRVQNSVLPAFQQSYGNM